MRESQFRPDLDEFRDLAEKHSINVHAFNWRIRNGWEPYEAATKPLDQKSHVDYYKFRELAKNNGINDTAFDMRLRNGWDLKTAATKKMKRKPTKTYYKVFRGDKLLVEGDVNKCAAHMKITHSTFYWYATPSAKRYNPETSIRVVAIRE